MASKVVTSRGITRTTNLSSTPHAEITLHSGRNLLAQDIGGSSDPYVVFIIGSETVTSKVQYSTLNPNFQDQKFLVKIEPHAQDLTVRVSDWDRFSGDDLIGTGTLWLHRLPKGQEVKRTVVLGNKAGEIDISIKLNNAGCAPEEYAKYAAEEQAAASEGQATTTKKFAPVVTEGEAKQAKLEDSNVSGIGSSADIEQRLKAASSEAAWKTAGKETGLQIWRIEKLQVKPWPKEQYGHFYSGDSYIVLNTWKSKSLNVFKYDVHFWLGEHTSQDEMTVAAYKTVELDDFLSRAPVEHREVQGYESDLFVSYFPQPIVIMQGGIDSGFNHVKPQEYVPRLLQIKGKKIVRVKEVPLKASSLNKGDIFILDAGLTIYEWFGSNARKQEAYRALAVTGALKGERGGKPQVERLEEEGSPEFWKLLGGSIADVQSASEGGDDEAVATTTGTSGYKVVKMSDQSGKLTYETVATGSLSRGMLDTADVFLCDVGSRLFVWVGQKASKKEKGHAMLGAQKYIIDNQKPNHYPVSRILEGGETSFFEQFFTA